MMDLKRNDTNHLVTNNPTWRLIIKTLQIKKTYTGSKNKP